MNHHLLCALDNDGVNMASSEKILYVRHDRSITSTKSIHKKNIYSALLDGDRIYTASQDGSVKIVDKNRFEIIREARKVITNMSIIVGLYRGHLLIANPRRNEISVWDAADLTPRTVFSFPVGGLNSGGIIIHRDKMIGSDSRGVYWMDMTELEL